MTCILCSSNGDQEDDNGDCIGNVCDTSGVSDKDGDDYCDNYPDDSNPDQTDTDGDGWGDECDSCPDVYLPFQHVRKCLSKGTIQVSLSMEETSEERKQHLLAKIMEKLLGMYIL